MIKVKCIGSIMSQNYFAGEYYEISQATLDQNPTCFEKVSAKKPDEVTESPVEETKVMKTKDIKKK